MAAISTIIAGIGLAAGLAGTAVQVAGAGAASRASARAEKLREKQMNLESARQKRQIMRSALRARASALNSATAQGATGGSGLQGGYGQIGQGAGDNLLGVNNAQEIGAGIFKANIDSAGAQSLVAFGGGLSSLGGSLIDNSSTLGNITRYLTGNKGP